MVKKLVFNSGKELEIVEFFNNEVKVEIGIDKVPDLTNNYFIEEELKHATYIDESSKEIEVITNGILGSVAYQRGIAIFRIATKSATEIRIDNLEDTVDVLTQEILGE